ncbi:GntR family transcriptional regulator [Paenibacillus frigoriresistens]|uniref:GntR family transcriptional regulator n=1 Tax=Paenibacillus alginolyticus TaxID=59839 RepID=UPI00156356E0|nr:GntR family transcriptional regulator [Paenibacillus frigoriresistens]NRF94608.1 GntR family transcriptional regulator [Paenibacillus frigoriresistens]
MSEEMNIMDHLIADIQAGKYDPDDKLPSENELADLFRVPRMTARKAYERLQELGYIYSKQGKGSFVKDRHQRIPLVLSGNESFSKKMIELGYNYQAKNIFCEPIEYNNKIYQALGVDEQDRVFKVGILRIIDGEPIALHASYVAETMFSDIEKAGREITSMFEFYKGRGLTEFHSTQTLLSVMYPSKYERELLSCSSLIPLLVLESERVEQTTGRTLEYSKIWYRGDFFTYVL